MVNIDIAYPLHWPEGMARTSKPKQSRFNTTFGKSRGYLLSELTRLGARYHTVSTNVNLRRDGLPYAGQSEPNDKGVAVYFELNGKPMCFACDRWDKMGCNIHAVAKSIEAMRGLDRWGCSEILNRAFDGFLMLPSNAESQPSWCKVLDVSPDDPHEKIKTNYRLLAKEHHPDQGGSAIKFREVQEAWSDYQKAVGDA